MRPRLRSRLPSKSVTFVVLMFLAAILSLLPASWTRWQRGATQLLGPAQWGLSSVARSAREATSPADSTRLSTEETVRLQEENDELRRLVAQQGTWLEDLERRYDEISGLRRQLGDSGARILIAPVWSYDASPRRDTLLIGRGSVDGIERGMWVAAGARSREPEAGETGRQALMRQWLIGRVSEVQPYASRVVLASDPKFGDPQAGERVLLAKVLEDGRWQPTAAKYMLTGSGQGRMVIRQADADYWSQGYRVVLVPASAGLPVMLSIGRIVGSARLPESALHYDLQVEGWTDVRDLRQVYVILARP